MPIKVFRFFISSTFGDFSEERRLLQQYVFPEVKRYCYSLNKGYVFQPIDLRWGISHEAQIDQKTLEVCIEEVKTSKAQPHPNFLIMLGNRYGWVPLPNIIDAEEFEKIRNYVKNNIDELQISYPLTSQKRKINSFELLNEWYKKDDNQIPSSYILEERVKTNFIDYTLYNNWQIEEELLKNILQKSVLRLHFSKQKRDKYFLSATEHEVIHGIFKYLSPTKHQKELKKANVIYEYLDFQNVYGYIRNIESLDDDTFKSLFKDVNDVSINKFKKRLKKSLYSNNLIEQNVHIKEIHIHPINRSLQYNYEWIEKEVNSNFVKSITQNIKKSIDKFAKQDQFSEDTLEIYEQEKFKNDKLKFFLGRKEALDKIQLYINGNENQVLVIHGTSGMGKSSLIAKAIESTHKKKIFRFLGTTSRLSSSVHLLISILKEMDINETLQKNLNLKNNQEEYEPVENFFYRVHEHFINYREEVVIFIDAIDQLSNLDEFLWLPIQLPKNLKIVISALDDPAYLEDSLYFKILQSKTSNIYKLDSFKEGIILLETLLKNSNRKLSFSQLDYVKTLYDEIHSPLYLVIAAEELKHWKCNPMNGETKRLLANNQKGIIQEYIENLSKIYYHDNTFVRKCFSYIFLANGLSETELLELISSNQQFIEYIAPETYHSNVTKELPVVIWSRLYFQIKDFLKIEICHSKEVMNFFHREFKDAVSCWHLEKDILEFVFILEMLILRYQHFPLNTTRYGYIFIDLITQNEYKSIQNINAYLDGVNTALLYDYNSINKESISAYGYFISKLENKDFILEFINYLEQIENNNITIKIIHKVLLYYLVYNKRIDSNIYWFQKYLVTLKDIAQLSYYEGTTNIVIQLKQKILNEIKINLNESLSQQYASMLLNLASTYKDVGNPIFSDYEDNAYNISANEYLKNSKEWAFLYIQVLLKKAHNGNNVHKIQMFYFLKALALSKKNFMSDPEKFRELYLRSLNGISNICIRQFKYQKAILFSNRALLVLETPYNIDPNKWAKEYIINLNTLLKAYKNINAYDKYFEIATKTYSIVYKLYRISQSAWSTYYIIAIENFAKAHINVRNYKEAYDLYQLSLDQLIKSYEKNKHKYKEYYLNCLTDLILLTEILDFPLNEIQLYKSLLQRI